VLCLCIVIIHTAHIPAQTGQETVRVSVSQETYFHFWGLHPVASITNNLWGCCQSQQYFFWMFLLLFHIHYMFRPLWAIFRCNIYLLIPRSYLCYNGSVAIDGIPKDWKKWIVGTQHSSHQPLMTEAEKVPEMYDTNSTVTWLIIWEHFIIFLLQFLIPSYIPTHNCTYFKTVFHKTLKYINNIFPCQGNSLCVLKIMIQIRYCDKTTEENSNCLVTAR
jgi:hypothetical protein